IAAGPVVYDAGDPRTCRAAADQCDGNRAEYRAVVRTLENLDDDRSHHRCQRVAEKALREHHDVEQRGRWRVLHCDKDHIRNPETGTARGPYPFTADPVR